MLVHLPREFRLIPDGITFHLAVFFAVSGILADERERGRGAAGAAETEDRGIAAGTVRPDYPGAGAGATGTQRRDAAVRAARNILIPYAFMSIMYILFRTVLCIMHGETADILPTACDIIFKTVSGVGVGTLWFLPAMLAARGIYGGVKAFPKRAEGVRAFRKSAEDRGKRTDRNAGSFSGLIGAVSVSDAVTALISLILLVCGSAIAQLLSSSGVIGTAYTYTDGAAGYVLNLLTLLIEAMIGAGLMGCGSFMWKISEKLRVNIPLSLLKAVVLLTINGFLYRYYDGCDMHLGRIGCAWAFALCTLTGCGGVMFLSCVLAKVRLISGFLRYFGRNSLIVMVTHLEYGICDIAVMIAALCPGGVPAKICAIAVLCFIEAVIAAAAGRIPIMKKIFRQ